MRIRDTLISYGDKVRIYWFGVFLVSLAYLIGIYTCNYKIFQYIVCFCSAFLAYSALIPYGYFNGKIKKIYFSVLISVISLFFVEACYTLLTYLDIQYKYPTIIYPVIFIALLSAYIAVYYVFEFWIYPIVGTKKIFFVLGLVSIAIVSDIMFILGVKYGVSFLEVLLGTGEFTLFILVLYEYRYFRGGILSKSWIFLLLMIGMILLGDLLNIFSGIIYSSDMRFIVMTLDIIGYLLGSYGFFIHKF